MDRQTQSISIWLATTLKVKYIRSDWSQWGVAKKI